MAAASRSNGARAFSAWVRHGEAFECEAVAEIFEHQALDRLRERDPGVAIRKPWSRRHLLGQFPCTGEGLSSNDDVSRQPITRGSRLQSQNQLRRILPR
jgi:hypothetical protein